MRLPTILTTVLVALGVGAPAAVARPLQTVHTGADVCPHGTAATWHVAYERFGAVNFTNLTGPVHHQTYGYVSEIDAVTPDASVLQYELLQGMSRFFETRGARFAPNPQTGIDAYCKALARLGYTDLHHNTATLCTSDRYADDLIAGTVPHCRGITHALWRRHSVSRSGREHHTLPAGLPIDGDRGISLGAGPH